MKPKARSCRSSPASSRTLKTICRSIRNTGTRSSAARRRSSSSTKSTRRTTVRQELKETYSAIEEAKADISSLFAIQYLIDKGVMPKALERPLYTTFLASTFRSIRFGINEAHGRGIAIQLNDLLDKGAV